MKPSRIVPPLLFALLIIAGWQLACNFQLVSNWILPSPWQVLQSFFQNQPLIWHHLLPTLLEALTGLLISIVAGICTALLMDSFRWFRQALYPFLVISQTVPIIAVAPLLIIWFGYGVSAKIFAVVLMCFFPIALSMYDGLRSVDIQQIRLLTSMGAGKACMLRLLKIPSALPGFFTGLKLSATYCVMGAVIGEWLGGNAGLGIYLIRATKSYQTAQVFVVILVIVLLSLLLYGLVTGLERLTLAWKYHREDEFEEP